MCGVCARGYRPRVVSLGISRQTCRGARPRCLDHALQCFTVSAMFCWRALCRLYKYVWILLLYYVLYSLLMAVYTADAPMTFVSEELRARSEYVLMFVSAPPRPALSDVDAADVFATRRCGRCFLTNNKGFLPMSEFDAILVHGDSSLLYDAGAAMEPNKRYLIETTNKCLRNKLQACLKEPKITSFDTRETYTLCSLCEHLTQLK